MCVLLPQVVDLRFATLEQWGDDVVRIEPLAGGVGVNEVWSLRVSPANSTVRGLRVNGPAGDVLKRQGVDIAQTADGAVDQVLTLARSVQPARHFDFARHRVDQVDRLRVVSVSV